MSSWTAAMVAGIAAAPLPALPVIGAAEVVRTLPGVDLWDQWPVQHPDGSVAAIAGGELWFALSAPAEGDPTERHARARLRLLRRAAAWHDLGDALPDGLSPGSREWSGSAVLEGDTLTLYFTAAGRRGEAATTFEQRLFATTARLGDGPRLDGWSEPVELVASDGVDYVVAAQATGSVGTIKAFRDPAFFRDPADGGEHLLFTASLAQSTSAFNGAVGVARQTASGWTLGPPLVTADGVNNELERPHIVVNDGLYYLFWSTQRSVFAPGIDGPTGLYAMVADRFAGPWRPVNGTGLVLANPAAEPMQAYSWLVLADLRIASFVDYWGLGGRPLDTVDARAHFGGVPAPIHHLTLSGDRAW